MKHKNKSSNILKKNYRKKRIATKHGPEAHLTLLGPTPQNGPLLFWVCLIILTFKGLRSCQTSMTKLFVKIVNNRKPYTMFAKSSIADVRLGPKYAPLRNNMPKIDDANIYKSESINIRPLKLMEPCSESTITNLNGHMIFIWHPGHHMNVLWTFTSGRMFTKWCFFLVTFEKFDSFA